MGEKDFSETASVFERIDIPEAFIKALSQSGVSQEVISSAISIYLGNEDDSTQEEESYGEPIDSLINRVGKDPFRNELIKYGKLVSEVRTNYPEALKSPKIFRQTQEKIEKEVRQTQELGYEGGNIQSWKLIFTNKNLVNWNIDTGKMYLSVSKNFINDTDMFESRDGLLNLTKMFIGEESFQRISLQYDEEYFFYYYNTPLQGVDGVTLSLNVYTSNEVSEISELLEEAESIDMVLDIDIPAE